jgi:hypothetical protein
MGSSTRKPEYPHDTNRNPENTDTLGLLSRLRVHSSLNRGWSCDWTSTPFQTVITSLIRPPPGCGHAKRIQWSPDSLRCCKLRPICFVYIYCLHLIHWKSDRVGSGRVVSCRTGSSRICSSRVGPDRVELGGVGPSRIWSNLVGSDRVESGGGCGRIESGLIGSGRVQQDRVELGRVMSGRIGSNRVGSSKTESNETQRLPSQNFSKSRLSFLSSMFI